MLHNVRSYLLVAALLAVALLSACRQEEPPPPPTMAVPGEGDGGEAGETGDGEAVVPATETPEAGSELTAEIGIDPRQISLDTQGLPEPWQAVAVPASPFDASQPPGPRGLPAHIQILFGATDPAQRDPSSPVMYIIPVDAYRELWDAAGNDAVSQSVQSIFEYAVALPFPAPTAGMPALPFEAFGGVNDLAAQVGRAVPADEQGAEVATKSGFRFAGRWMQDPNPVTNQGLRYVYQGFTNNGEYLVAFYYPTRTNQIPDSTETVPEDQLAALNSDPAAYLQSRAEFLNSLPTSEWQPDLATLDDVVRSLQIVGMAPNGLENTVWTWAAKFDPNTGDEIPTQIAGTYSLTFNADGTFNFVADCNSGLGNFDATGGIAGSIAMQPGPSTLVACEPDSLFDEFSSLITSAQAYRVLPGGQEMELLTAAGGPSYVFLSSGAVDVVPPGTEQPPVDLPDPGAGTATGEVTAESGVNVRTGPGGNFPIIGVAPVGTRGEVVGRSADGEWLATPVQSAPNGLGWVAAAFVTVTNGQNIPVIDAPPPPLPTPTATPQATATPSPSVSFTANRTNLTAGQCATLTWDVENIQAVWMYPRGERYTDFPVTGQGSQEVCPPYTTTYELRVQHTDGVVEIRQITIQVQVSDPLAGTSWALTSLNGATLVANTFPTLIFGSDNSVSGSGGCNTFNGPYSVNGSGIFLGPLTNGMQACEADIMAQEQLYLNNLESAATYSLNGNQLSLRRSGETLATFVRSR